jgi:hypothetical protein
MATKKKKTDPPPTVITITLPEGGIEREGIVVVKRGDTSRVRKFPYQTMNQVMEAVVDVTRQLNVDIAAAANGSKPAKKKQDSPAEPILEFGALAPVGEVAASDLTPPSTEDGQLSLFSD